MIYTYFTKKFEHHAAIKMWNNGMLYTLLFFTRELLHTEIDKSIEVIHYCSFLYNSTYDVHRLMYIFRIEHPLGASKNGVFASIVRMILAGDF